MEVNVRLATKEDSHLPTFDNTKLEAINTCPTWGILRYEMHKQMPNTGRSLALEAGSTMHDVFAAIRLLELKETLGLNEHFLFHGIRIFGAERWDSMLWYLNQENEDEPTRQWGFICQALHSSGYYDDPNDRKRTLTNMEASAYAYWQRYEFGRYPVFVADREDPQSLVGIEIPFDLVVLFKFGDLSHEYRFTGKIDGLHIDPKRDNELILQENKTTSALGSAWGEQYALRHQPTGYCIAASIIANQGQCRRCIMRGLMIQLKRGDTDGSIVTEHVTRHDYHITKWFEWFWHTVEVWEKYKDKIEDAPIYTHSCYRFFKPCVFLAFCDSSREDKQTTLEQLVDDEWSPLKQAGDD